MLVDSVGFAATFNVNTTGDLVDANPGDGVCQAAGGSCSVRAAVMEANALAGPDIIAIPSGTYLLTIDGVDDEGAVGDLDAVGDTLTINGAGAGATILDGNGIDRVIHQTAGTLSVNDVTIRNGVTDADVNVGGAVLVSGFGEQPAEFTLRRSRVLNNSAKLGGALRANAWATLVIEDTLFQGNETIEVGGGNRRGAAIYCQGCHITFDRCTFTDNGDALSGKIIDIENDAQLLMLNSTVSGNPFGGGIALTNAHGLIKFSTLVNNGAQNLSFFSFDDSHVFEVAGTVLQNDTHDNCQSGGDLPASLGYNVVGDETCAFTESGDVEGVDAVLDSLADNGGQTPSHEPEAGSPAINRVPPASCTGLDGITPLLIDQRDMDRPFGPGCEAGSVEVGLLPILRDGFESR